MPGMALPQIIFLLILAAGLYLFVSERLRIDERHGGRIDADSGPDGGATFIIDLPAAESA